MICTRTSYERTQAWRRIRSGVGALLLCVRPTIKALGLSPVTGAGFLDKPHGHRFLYAMEVIKRIHMDVYFKDERFREKQPLVRGSWMQRCGDNFYSQDDLGRWQQHETLFHAGPAYTEWDTKHPWVFYAKRF